MRVPAWKCVAAAAALVGLMAGSSGCFGGFRATSAIYHWNKGIGGGKWVQWLVFFGLFVIPVYELFALGDILIFNSLEFWTGSNPLALRDAKEPVEAIAMNDGSITFLVGERRYRLAPIDDRSASLSLDGVEIGRVERTADGGLALIDLAHARSRQFGPEEIIAAKARAEREIPVTLRALE